MKLNLQLKAYQQVSAGGPVYGEPYDGFFKERGFRGDRTWGFCDWSESYRQSSRLAFGFKVNLPFFIGSVINLNRVFFYDGVSLKFKNYSTGCGIKKVKCTDLSDLIMTEEVGGNTDAIIKGQLAAVHKAGGQAWYGYVVSINTTGSVQTALAEENFSTARSTMQNLNLQAISSAKQIYPELTAKKITKLEHDLDQLYLHLFLALSERMNEAMAGNFDAEMTNLSEPEQSRKSKEIIEKPIDLWLPKIEQAIIDSGLGQCEQKLYDSVSDYCSKNKIPLVKSESGSDFRKSAIMAFFEDEMR